MEFDKKQRLAVCTTALTLLPAAVGLLLWSRLPQSIAIHFGMDGTPDGYCSKAAAVFGVWCIPLACHILVALLPNEQAKSHLPRPLATLIYWFCPALSNYVAYGIYGYALGYGFDANSFARWVMLLVGALLIVMGNYMPKSRPNRYFGVRYAATLNDPEIWRRVNLFAGWSMSACGALIILAALLLPIEVTYVIILACVLLYVGSYGYAMYLARKR